MYKKKYIESFNNKDTLNLKNNYTEDDYKIKLEYLEAINLSENNNTRDQDIDNTDFLSFNLMNFLCLKTIELLKDDYYLLVLKLQKFQTKLNYRAPELKFTIWNDLMELLTFIQNNHDVDLLLSVCWDYAFSN